MKANYLRTTFKAILLSQREKAMKALIFYKELLQRVPKEEAWIYYQESPYYDSMKGLLPVDTISPVCILETAVDTIDEYVEAIDSFNDRELAAFLLGLGLHWFPLRYWGVKELNNQLAKINAAMTFYKDLENKIPSSELWKFEKQCLFEILPGLISPEIYKPTDALRILKELVEGMISILEQKS